jgi:hypothetical protein
MLLPFRMCLAIALIPHFSQKAKGSQIKRPSRTCLALTAYPPQFPLGKEGSPVLPLAKGELEGVSQGTLNTYDLG